MSFYNVIIPYPYSRVIRRISLISAYSLISAGQLVARYLAHLAYKRILRRVYVEP